MTKWPTQLIDHDESCESIATKFAKVPLLRSTKDNMVQFNKILRPGWHHTPSGQYNPKTGQVL